MLLSCLAVFQVGGTSQGALVGALLALYPDDPDARDRKARIFALSMASVRYPDLGEDEEER